MDSIALMPRMSMNNFHPLVLAIDYFINWFHQLISSIDLTIHPKGDQSLYG